MSDIKTKILLATLPHVPFDGWSEAALKAGVEDAGLSAETAVLAFPGGISDLIEHFSRYSDMRMVEVLQSEDLAAMRVRDRIIEAVRLRLDLVRGHREEVRRALAYTSLPSHVPLGVKCLYRTVDEIWRALGDTSADFNFYSKRAILAGVYTSTLLFWLEDTSDEFEETWAFLERRIGNVMEFEKVKGRLRSWVGNLPDPGEILRRCTPK